MLPYFLLSLFILGYFDAKRLQTHHPQAYGDTFKFSPIKWAIYLSLGCVIGGLVYLYRRSQFLEEHPLSTTAVNARSVCIMWLLSVLGLSLISWILFEQTKIFSDELLVSITTTFLASLILVGLIMRFTAHEHGGFKTIVAYVKPKQSWLWVLPLTLVLSGVFAFSSALFVTQRSLSPETPLTEMMKNVQSPITIVFFIFVGLFVAPLIEEISFRGYFFDVLKKVRGKVFSIVAISLSFALMHVHQYWGDWLAIIMVTLLGFSFTLLRSLTGSVIPSIIAHYAYNIGVTIFTVYFSLFVPNIFYQQFLDDRVTMSVDQKKHILQKSIDKQPMFAPAYYEMARIAFNNQEYGEALRLMNHALEFYPLEKEYLVFKEDLLRKTNRFEELDQFLQKYKGIF